MRSALVSVIVLTLATSASGADWRYFPRCPQSPNCVATTATDAQHAIPPMRFRGPQKVAMQQFEQLLRGMARVRITRVDSNSIHAEFRTAVFRFVDDAVFVFDGVTGTIHFRSASRVGYSDLGVNRRRMESIRSEWTRRGG